MEPRLIPNTQTHIFTDERHAPKVHYDPATQFSPARIVLWFGDVGQHSVSIPVRHAEVLQDGIVVALAAAYAEPRITA